MAKGIQLAGTAFVEEVAVEGKVGAESAEGADEFHGASVGVEKETSGGQSGSDAKGVVKRTPGVDAMDGGGAVPRGGEGELCGEYVELFFERRAAETGETRVVGTGAVGHPAVETDLADGGGRMSVECSGERGEPVGGTIADMPRMKAEAWCDPGGMRVGEGEDLRPVGFRGAVDDGAAETEGRKLDGDFYPVRDEPLVVEMIVCVVKRERHRREETERDACTVRSGCEVFFRERFDASADGRETIATGGGQVA